MIESNDLTPQELHRIDSVYKISEKRQLHDENGCLLLSYDNNQLLDKYPNLGFLCYEKLNEKYSVLHNRGCMGIMKKFDGILGYIMQQDDIGNADNLWFEMRAEPESFILKWYLGKLDEDIYIDSLNQQRMYRYIRQYRTQLTEEERRIKPKKTNDGITIQEKCEKAGLNYRRVLRFRHFHPELTEDEIIKHLVEGGPRIKRVRKVK